MLRALPYFVFALALAAQTDSASRANSLQQQGKLDEARAEFARARSDARAKADFSGAADASERMAQIDLRLGHYADSRTEASEALAAAASGRQGPDKQATILTTLAQAHFYAGDSAKARAAFLRAVELNRAASDGAGEVTTLNNLGNISFADGRFGDALNLYQQAERRALAGPGEKWFESRLRLTRANLAILWERIGQYDRALRLYKELAAQSESLPPVEQAQLLANMGTLYRRLGDTVTALEKYREAEAIYHGSRLAAGEAGVLNNIGIANALSLHNNEGAIRAFAESLRIARDSGAKRLELPALLYRGEAWLRSNHKPEARADFEEAAALAAQLGAEEEKWRAAYGRAKVEAAEGRESQSAELLREAIGIIERMRSRAASNRSGFLMERRDVYDALIGQIARSGHSDVDTLFDLMEHSRARQLQDRTNRAGRIGDLSARIPPGTAVLDYWTDGRTLLSILLTHTNRVLHTSEFQTASRNGCQELAAAVSDTRRTDWPVRARLCASAVLPDAAELAGVKRLIIAPDADLARIPFDVLPFGGGMLIDAMSVAYVPFASALNTSGANPPFAPPWSRTLYAYANPAAGSGAFPTAIRSAIPDAEAEVREAASALGGRAVLRLGRDATKASLFAIKDGAPVLHFATHGFADPEAPDHSWILFSSANAEAADFDYLFLDEAPAVEAARGALVTVSACDSGTGKPSRGEGIESFASGFLAAGAKAVVTSMWLAGDRSSAELMGRFYERLSHGETVGEALRSAQLEFRRSARASHPAFWAGFTVTGDDAAITPRVIRWPAFALAAIVIAFALWSGARLILHLFRTRAGTG